MTTPISQADAQALLAQLKHAINWFDQLTKEDAARYQAVVDRVTGAQQ